MTLLLVEARYVELKKIYEIIIHTDIILKSTKPKPVFRTRRIVNMIVRGNTTTPMYDNVTISISAKCLRLFFIIYCFMVDRKRSMCRKDTHSQS